MAIHLDLILAGDTVTLQDPQRNLCEGQVRRVSDLLVIDAFGLAIPFARRNRAGAWSAISAARVVAHQPPLLRAYTDV